MKFTDLLYVTFQNFSNRKSRVFFTVLGVAVANAVVLSLVSFGYGLQKNVLQNITTQESLLTLDIFPSDANLINFDQAMVDKIKGIKNVEKVSAVATFPSKISFNGTISEARVNVINADFFALDGKEPLAGAFFTETDKKKMVASSLTAQLFDLTDESILGTRMVFTIAEEKMSEKTDEKNQTEERTYGADFNVVGVIEGGGNTAELFVQRSDVPELAISQYQFAKVKVIDPDYMEDVRAELINQGFIVSSLSDIATQANKIFNAVQITLGIFGVFALIVAAIGLVNTMTISLLERTNEIGIMRAIGAAPTDIKRIFLGESVVIGFMGGVAGIALGILSSEILNWGFNILAASLGGDSIHLFYYPAWFVVFIVVLSTVVGFLGGMWPAFRAASMNPLQALRYK